MPGFSEREEAYLRVIREAFGKLGWNLTPVNALAADLEAAEREADLLKGTVGRQRSKLATAREALERELRLTHGEATKDRIRVALRSLEES